MLDLVKNNAVPAAVMRSAAKGALSLPAAEMLQILIYLTGNAVFGNEARMTLARWDEASTLAVLSSADAPREVVEYFFDQRNRRPALMPALIENPQVSEQHLADLAKGASRELVEYLLASPRVRGAHGVLDVLLENPHLTQVEVQQLRSELGYEAPNPEAEAAHEAWRHEHSAEIEAEEGTAFELTGVLEEPEEFSIAPPPPEKSAVGMTPRPVNPHTLSAPVKVSTLVKISRMNVAERVKTGFIGNKEERAILVRDSARIVQNSVLASPKVSESEIETFAAAKNVSENVLREIGRNRRFMKIYAVVRNLVNNPRCPLDLSLTLVKNLLVGDLKNLQGNKGVPDTLRKVATKLYKEKKAPVGQKAEP